MIGKYLTHCLKCLSSHLAIKNFLTKCCNFGYKYSMNSCDVVFSYTKVNFFNGWPFLAIVVSRTKQRHWIMFEYDLVTSFLHNDNFYTPQLGQLPNKQLCLCKFSSPPLRHTITPHMSIIPLYTTHKAWHGCPKWPNTTITLIIT